MKAMIVFLQLIELSAWTKITLSNTPGCTTPVVLLKYVRESERCHTCSTPQSMRSAQVISALVEDASAQRAPLLAGRCCCCCPRARRLRSPGVEIVLPLLVSGRRRRHRTRRLPRRAGRIRPQGHLLLGDGMISRPGRPARLHGADGRRVADLPQVGSIPLTEPGDA